MAHDKGSFDYKAIDSRIRNILDKRSEIANTVQVGMPFIKATTTIKHPDLGDGYVGFTLGTHALDKDVRYEDLYAERNGETPLIGYTYSEEGTTKLVYAKNYSDQTIQVIQGAFDKRALLYSNTDYISVPPPGIVSAKISRGRNGVLAYAELTISVPSLLQLESLHKLFLVPGLGMVLEWGQHFADDGNEDFGERGITAPIVENLMFPWYSRQQLLELLDRLARNQVGLQEILDEYVYPTQGQYMWMFGRVANFSITANSDGSFDCVVKLVGPSEDSWAYSTRSTVVPAKDPSSRVFCAESANNSVYSYFNNTASGGLNLKSLLDKAELTNHPWYGHVKKFTQGNLPKEAPTKDMKNPSISQTNFGNSEDAYFMTWRFFVNVVLNDEVDGLKAIFKNTLTREELNKVGMLLPYADGPNRENKDVRGLNRINDPMESYVGLNKYLRSVDPSVMIIVNEMAATLAESDQQYQRNGDAADLLKATDESLFMKKAGLFETSADVVEDTNFPDRGFLSTGVWLNHKTVVECMLSGDTIMRGISLLLGKMNQASQSYWKLTLDVAEPIATSTHPYNYMVVDENWKESSTRAVQNFLDKVHIFNKYIRYDKDSGKLVGSELIECNLDLSLPKRLFTQIATLGLVSKTELDIVTSGSRKGDTPLSTRKNNKISDPNDTLRHMFGITSLSPGSDDEQGPDLTILPKTERQALLKQNGDCSGNNVQTTGQTAGEGNKTGPTSLSENLGKMSSDEFKKTKKEAEDQVNTETCRKCEECAPPATSAQVEIAVGNYAPPSTGVGGSPYSPPPDFAAKKYSNADIPLRELVGIAKGALARYTYQGTGNWFLLHPEAARQYKLMEAAAKSQGIRWTITSAYRDYSHQVSLGKKNTVAAAGSSPHGWGGAIDIGELYSAVRRISVNAMGDPAANKQIRTSSKLYNWLAINGPAYGWYNPARLADGAGTDECWHFEYHGFVNKPTNAPPTLPVPRGVTPPANATKSTVPNAPAPTQPAQNKCDTVYQSVGATVSSTQSQRSINAKTGLPTDTTSTPEQLKLTGKRRCDECARAKDILAQSKLYEERAAEKEQVDAKIREFYNLRQMFRYIEIFPDYMVANITDTSNGTFANAFGASPGSLSINADLVMPGVNGFRIGELFWIDRVPTFYKAFGAFQIMNFEDNITIEGWTTSIHSVFNFLGTNWKSSIEKILKGGN